MRAIVKTTTAAEEPCRGRGRPYAAPCIASLVASQCASKMAQAPRFHIHAVLRWMDRSVAALGSGQCGSFGRPCQPGGPIGGGRKAVHGLCCTIDNLRASTQ